MSRAYDYWVYQQLEPEATIHTGNARRYKPVDSVKEFIDKFGEDKYREMVEQDKADAERKQQEYGQEEI